MRILHITTNYPTPEFPIFGIFVKEQVESLQNLGLECDVFYCDGKNRGFKQYITYIPKLWWTIAKGNYDVIHCHHALSGIIACMTGWPFVKKCVLSYQNDPDREWGNKMFKVFNVIFNKFIVKNNSQYLRYKKVIYLPNGCNQNFFRPMDMYSCREELGLDKNKKYVIYMDSNKGIRTQKRRDRFDETVKILNERYGYKIETIVMRNTRRELVPLYLNAADLHMISSDFEGSPNSVKECMCCNTPVVSTNVGNVKEMIGDIPGAYVIDDFSPEALAEACNEVFQNSEPFLGRDLFLAKGYSMTDVAKKLETIYNDILK